MPACFVFPEDDSVGSQIDDVFVTADDANAMGVAPREFVARIAPMNGDVAVRTFIPFTKEKCHAFGLLSIALGFAAGAFAIYPSKR